VADIFSEVDEDVRKEKSLELWKKYGKYVIGGAVLIVVGTASYVAWQNYTVSQSASQGAAFEAAAALVSENKLAEGAASFGALAEEGNAGYRALSRLREAGLLVETGKGSEALAIYNELAADSSVDEEFSSLANLLAGYYLLDNGTTQEARDQVGPLVQAGSIWTASATELVALTYLQDGESSKAIEMLTALKNDASTPNDIKERVTQLLAALGGE
jgi:hypothetical protein